LRWLGGLGLLAGSEFITVYWLSGFAQEKFEIWKGRKDKDQPHAASTHFTIYLLFPLVEEDEAHLEIFSTPAGLHFSIDWFPGEEFPLKSFQSENRQELLLMSEFQRESVFLHLT
jgi:hypothetical protein